MLAYQVDISKYKAENIPLLLNAAVSKIKILIKHFNASTLVTPESSIILSNRTDTRVDHPLEISDMARILLI